MKGRTIMELLSIFTHHCVSNSGSVTMTNQGRILKSRDITFPSKVCIVRAMVPLVVIYGCEDCAIRNTEHRITDVFELWCWRRLLRVPWTVRRSDQWILKKPWIFIEGLMLDLKFPVLWPPDAKSQLVGKDPDAGKDWRQEEKGTTEDEMVGWHHQLNGNEFERTPGDDEGQGTLVWCSLWGHKSRTWLSNWTTRT